MPAFSNPLMMLLRLVAFSHGLRVSAATSLGAMDVACVCWCSACDDARYVLNGPKTEMSATWRR